MIGNELHYSYVVQKFKHKHRESCIRGEDRMMDETKGNNIAIIK